MKKLIPVLTLILLLTAVVISENSSSPNNPAKIAYVDMQRVLESTKDWKELNQSYQEDLQFYQKQLDELSQELQQMQQEGATQSELAEKQNELLSKKAQYEQTIQSTYNEKTQIIIERLQKRMKNYAEFTEYDLIITKEAVVYGKGTYDITNLVIEYLKGFDSED
ncbi:MAG: OmpH family outer membrane protein [Thermotogota bacterium]|nr:OmpH family outer membrane protein [Thermotogota bacterium]